MEPGKESFKCIFLDLKFINEETMSRNNRRYGANNIVHCFSRAMKFPDFLRCLSEEEKEAFTIDNYSYHDFMLGDDQPGKVKRRKFFHLPMPIHFAIKHQNQGKIESHKWFFKGFCEYMNPIYAQIID